MRRWIAIAGITLATWSCGGNGGGQATAAAPAAPAAPGPAPVATTPVPGAAAGQELAPDSTLDRILDALHQRGQGLADFSANVSLAEIDGLTGDTTTLVGRVTFQDKGNANGRIRVTFDRKLVGAKPVTDFKLDFILDKRWLIERDHKRKTEVQRQVLKEGQKMNLLKLGEGPFPLPVGQPPDEVRKMFEVTKVPPKADDPPGTVHVQLAPKPKTQFSRKFKRIDVWVDARSHFPRRIETADPQETSVRQTDLSEVKVNAGVDDKVFMLEVLPGDWRTIQEPMAE